MFQVLLYYDMGFPYIFVNIVSDIYIYIYQWQPQNLYYVTFQYAIVAIRILYMNASCPFQIYIPPDFVFLPS